VCTIIRSSTNFHDSEDEFCGIVRHVISYKQTDVLEVQTASIIRAIPTVMEEVGNSKTSVYFYETIRCHIPEDFHAHARRHENLNSLP
jgi:hypothetical protein